MPSRGSSGVGPRVRRSSVRLAAGGCGSQFAQRALLDLPERARRRVRSARQRPPSSPSVPRRARPSTAARSARRLSRGPDVAENATERQARLLYRSGSRHKLAAGRGHAAVRWPNPPIWGPGAFAPPPPCSFRFPARDRDVPEPGRCRSARPALLRAARGESSGQSPWRSCS
jgi:hypothetical protein